VYCAHVHCNGDYDDDHDDDYDADDDDDSDYDYDRLGSDGNSRGRCCPVVMLTVTIVDAFTVM
jgi:hypothetical protein